MIKTNILQYIGLYIEIIEARIVFDQYCAVLMVESLVEVWKVGPQYTQAIRPRRAFWAPPAVR